ncbi:hypothetical protein ACLOJK_028447 [Asimina triloba]
MSDVGGVDNYYHVGWDIQEEIVSIKPQLGMEFADEESGRIFYSSYAHANGLSIGKAHVRTHRSSGCRKTSLVEFVEKFDDLLLRRHTDELEADKKTRKSKSELFESGVYIVKCLIAEDNLSMFEVVNPELKIDSRMIDVIELPQVFLLQRLSREPMKNLEILPSLSFGDDPYDVNPAELTSILRSIHAEAGGDKGLLFRAISTSKRL